MKTGNFHASRWSQMNLSWFKPWDKSKLRTLYKQFVAKSWYTIPQQKLPHNSIYLGNKTINFALKYIPHRPLYFHGQRIMVNITPNWNFFANVKTKSICAFNSLCHTLKTLEDIFAFILIIFFLRKKRKFYFIRWEKKFTFCRNTCDHVFCCACWFYKKGTL